MGAKPPLAGGALVGKAGFEVVVVGVGGKRRETVPERGREVDDPRRRPVEAVPMAASSSVTEAVRGLPSAGVSAKNENGTLTAGRHRMSLVVPLQVDDSTRRADEEKQAYLRCSADGSLLVSVSQAT